MRVNMLTGAVYAVLCAGALGACSSGQGAAAPTIHTSSSKVASSPARTAGAAYDDPATVAAVLAAARADVPVVTGYDYRHIDEDIARGLEVTTGRFSTQYESAMRDTVASLAVSSRTVQTTQVATAGLVWLTGGKAEVLVFGQQAITNKATTSPRLDQLTIGVEMTSKGGTWKVSDVIEGGADQPDPPGTQPLKAAVAAGVAQVTSMLTYGRSTFARDTARAEAGAVGAVLTDLRKNSPTLRTQMMQGGFDLRGEIGSAATVSVSADHVVLLVAAAGYRVPDHGSQTLQTRARFQVDLVDVGGTWRTDELESIGLI